MDRPQRAGFTLVELLVVISIIVILLGLLVPGLNKALKYAEKANCAANQRNIAQGLVGYGLDDKKHHLPPAVGAFMTNTASDGNANRNDSSDVTTGTYALAMDYRVSNTASVSSTGPAGPVLARVNKRTSPLILAAAITDGTQFAAAYEPSITTEPLSPLGLGILPAYGILPSTQLGDVAHCPSLNTKSAAPTSNYGMDRAYAVGDTTTRDTTSARGAGGSYFLDGNEAQSRIVGSFLYRGTSYTIANGGRAQIKYDNIGPQFVLTTDFLDTRFGKKFHHKTGYNVSYGDGHVDFFEDGENLVEKFIATVDPKYLAIDGFSDYNTEHPNPDLKSASERIYNTILGRPENTE